MAALSLCAVLLAFSFTSATPIRRQASWIDQTWDAIVVGAGPAGIIVADKLSEAGKSTLLLEQGGSSYSITGGTESPAWLDGSGLSRVDVPGLYNSIFSEQGNLTCGSKLDAFGGCTIGGSSAINAGLFFQPPASDFDNYFPDGWKAADLQTAISNVTARQSSSSVTSVDGQYYLESTYDVTRQWLVDGAGFAEVDLNAQTDDKTAVFGRTIFDYANGQRGGPVTTYLQSALSRPHFQLQSGVQVKQILRDGAHATGVTAVVDGVEHTINVAADTGRVILSAGALFSPQLLMLSGIGDPAALAQVQQAGLIGDASTWINNAGVGSGLFDNPNTFIELSSPNVQSYTYNYSNPVPADADQYLTSRSGPYASASETAAFWDTITRADGTVGAFQGTIASSGSFDYTNATTITLNVYGTSGLGSTGRVVLDNNLIPGPSGDVYYSNPQDAQDIATFIRKIFDALPATTLTPLNLPQDATHDDIVTYITTASDYARGQVNHWSSSCRIGGCVDANTVVLGTDNVHVVDASILAPLTVNPQMGVMIAAEKAAELILGL